MAGEQGRAPGFEIRVAREAHVEWLELPRRLEQQPRRVAAAVLGERHLGVEQVHAGAAEFVERPGLRGREQATGLVERAGAEAGPCGRERPAGAREGSPVSATARCRNAAEAARPPRACARSAEKARARARPPRPGRRPRRPGARRVGPGRGRDGHLRQREMRRSALGPARGPVDGRPRQGMAEGHAPVDGQQSVGRVDRRQRDPEALARALEEQRIADRLGGRHQQ